MKIEIKTEKIEFNRAGKGIFAKGSKFDVWMSGVVVGSASSIEEAEKLVELWIVEGAGIIFNAFTEKRYPEFLETLTVSVYCKKNDYIRPGYLEDILITFIANDVKYKFNSYLKSTHNYQYTIDGRY